MSSSLPDSPALRERRERTISSLCEHFAQDRITLDEFEARLDLAHKALVPTDLDQLLADIRVPDAAPAPPTRTALAPAGSQDETRLVVAVMSGVERRGQWRPAARNYVLAVMGGAELDFRDTPLPEGTTEVVVLACMGGCEIIVPPGLVVETNGFALMGGFGHSDAAPPTPGSPILKITGFVLMGGVDISVRLPGETARDAKRRMKEDRRLRRDSR